jgi:hypothetical protein
VNIINNLLAKLNDVTNNSRKAMTIIIPEENPSPIEVYLVFSFMTVAKKIPSSVVKLDTKLSIMIERLVGII